MIIFMSVGLLLNIFLVYAMIEVSKIYKDGASIICEQKREMVRKRVLAPKKGGENVLVMGNSSILAAFVPAVFDSLLQYHYYSINLGLPAAPLVMNYFTLQDYLNNNDAPDYILLNLNIYNEKWYGGFPKYGLQGVSSLAEIYSYYTNLSDKKIVRNFFFPCNIYLKPIVKYCYNSIFNRNDFLATRQKNRTIIEKMGNNRGYYFIREQALFPDEKLPDNFHEGLHPELEMVIGDPFQDPYVQKFFDLAKEQKIKVLLIHSPFRFGRLKQFSSLPDYYEAVLAKYDNVFVAKNGWKFKYYQNSFFSDQVHMNFEGAVKYTKDIAKEFREVFGGNDSYGAY